MIKFAGLVLIKGRDSAMSSFWNWWQTIPYRIEPDLISIAGFQLKYYGLMYIIAFGLTFYLLNYRIQKKEFSIKKEQLENYFFYIIIFVLIGGRIGYVLFYNFSYFIDNPLEIFLPFSFRDGFEFTGIAGMSYHGALFAAAAGTYLFAKKNSTDFFRFSDFVVSAAPLGYTFGRLGNFINGELYGRVTDMPFGMYFPMAGDELLRHPSQLYEAFFEGIFIFLVLWAIRNKNFPRGYFLSLYLILYGTVRFFIEFLREPDEHIGFFMSWMTIGQILCLIMISSGIVIMFYQKKKAAV